MLKKGAIFKIIMAFRRAVTTDELLNEIGSLLGFRPEPVPFLIKSMKSSLESLLKTDSSGLQSTLREVHSIVESYFLKDKSDIRFAQGILYGVSEAVKSGALKDKNSYLDYLKSRLLNFSYSSKDDEDDKKPDYSRVSKLFGEPYIPKEPEFRSNPERVFSRIDRYHARNEGKEAS